MQLFALEESRYLGDLVAADLQISLAPLEERKFSDGEYKVRPLASVRDADIYVLQGLHGGPHLSPHDKFCRLLFLIAALRDHGAARVTVLIPYMIYARKDRRTKTRDPLNSRYVAQLLEAVGCAHIVTFAVHNIAAFENSFRCPTVNLDLGDVFQEIMAARLSDAQLIMVSPDPGGVKRAQLFREAIEDRIGQPVSFGFMEKRRSADVLTAGDMVGEFAGKTAIIVDDMIASGSTILTAARACRDAGAAHILAVAAHGLFAGVDPALFDGTVIDRVFITNSVPPFRLEKGAETHRLEIVSVAEELAEVIRRLSDRGKASLRQR